MKRCFIPLLFAAAVSALAAAVPQTPVPLTVHEWGTFLGMSGSDGRE